MIRDNTLLIRRPNTTTRQLNDSSFLVLDYEHSSLFQFNETGSLIWNLFQKKSTITEVAHIICNEYDIDYNKSVQDLKEFISNYEDLFINPNQIHLFERNKKRTNDIIYHQLEDVGFNHIIPTMIEIELTDKCNLDCLHCSVIPQKTTLLNTNDLFNLIDQIESLSCFEITFTGGEIFIRKDVLDIIDYSDKKNFSINILTNATLLTTEQIQSLSEYNGINNIQVSLYSTNPQVHDSITRISGSFEKSLKNIEKLLSRKVHVTLACVVMNKNYSSYNSIKKLANDLGCDYTISYPIRARNDGSPDTYNLRLTEREVFKLFRKEQNIFCGRYERNLDEPICHAGRAICYISAMGDVYPCIIFPLKVGNIKNNTLKEIWYNSPNLKYFRNLTIKDTYECKNCKLLEYCPICPGLSLLEEKDILTPSKINCILAENNQNVLKNENKI